MLRRILLFCVLWISFLSCCRNKSADNFYRYHASKITGYDIWIVDGEQVRNTFYSSFLYGGNEQRYPFNPKGEIWVDNAISCEEFDLTVAHELNERHLMAKFGWTYDKAHDSSLRIEVKMRREFDSLSHLHEESLSKMSVLDYSKKKEIKDIPDSVRLKKIYRIPLGKRNNIDIWIVDGYMVRKNIYPDFGFSGNDLAYHFIPSHEIWIDGQISCEQTEYSIATELKERKEMEKGKSYSDAYLIAINQTMELRTAQQKLILQHPPLPIPDTITRDSGIIDPHEK